MMVAKTVTLDGHPRTIYGLYENDTYFNEIADNYHWELADICKRMLPPDANCWDIGANIGVTCLVLASSCSEGRIVAVEAGRKNFDLLQKNIDQNGLRERVVPVYAAVGDHDGQVNFMDASAYGYIVPKGTPTRLISPLTLANEFGPKSIDFMKIDIEGFEFPFMKARIDLFRKYETIIHMEFNGWCMFWNARIDPIEFMEWILGNFEGAYIIDRFSSGLRPYNKDNMREIMHEILVESNTVRDLLLTTNPNKIR